MSEVLVVLQPSITQADREAIGTLVQATQSISTRVFLTTANDAVLARLRSTTGIAKVLTGTELDKGLPALDEAEALFVQAWLSSRGQTKQRRGDGMDWDTPPMLPPDPKH